MDEGETVQGLRCQLRELESKPLGDEEFIGCSATEVGHATRRSDDSSDGNPQQSAVGDGTRPHTLTDAASWQPGGLDVRALARTVLGALPPSPTPLPFNEVLRRTARTDAEVSHVLLSTLFLASAGNVHIEAGAPLTVNSFSVRLLHSELPAGEPGDPFLQ